MVGNPFSKGRFQQTSTSRADRLLIGGIVAGVALFWLVMVTLVMRLTAAVG